MGMDTVWCGVSEMWGSVRGLRKPRLPLFSNKEDRLCPITKSPEYEKKGRFSL